MPFTFGNISFKLVLLTPGAKPHINSLFERIFGDISSCKACSCADWRKSTWSGLICWAPCPQIWPSVTCSCSPGWCVVGNDPRSFKKKIIFTSPTKSTMSSLPLNCVVASFPLAALHSSELPNSTKAYLQMWVLDPFRLLELDIEKVTLTWYHWWIWLLSLVFSQIWYRSEVLWFHQLKRNNTVQILYIFNWKCNCNS